MSETISKPDTVITIPSAAEMVKKIRLKREMDRKKDELSYERSCSKFKQ